MKMIWSCTKPTKLFDVIEYTIYNNVNKTEIKCKSHGKMKEVKEAIHVSLKRMNMGKGNYTNGLR